MEDARVGDELAALTGVELVSLAANLSAEGSAGEALEDEVFALEQRAAPQHSLVEGSVDRRNWLTIRGQAAEMLSRSRDLRIAVVLAQALANTHGWFGFERGIAAIELLLAQHWDRLHPALDEDGHAYRRANALAALASPEMLSDLRRACVLTDLHLADLLDAKTKDAALRSAFLDAPAAERGASARVRASLESIQARMAKHEAPVHELDALVQLAEQASARMRALVAKFSAEVPAGQGGGDEAPGAGAPRRPAEPERGVGAIGSAADVLLAIDRICEYYQRCERSSPVPLLLMRARRLVNRSFLEVVQDLADKGLPQIQGIAGSSETPK